VFVLKPVFAGITCYVAATPVDVPLVMKEEEEGGGGPSHADLLQWSQDAVLDSFGKWLNENKPHPYKYIALILNAQTTGLESSLREHTEANLHWLDAESGPDLLILHSDTPSNDGEASSDLIRKTARWIEYLQISRISLPCLFVMPHSAFSCVREKRNSLVYSMAQPRTHWDGSDADYFTYTFRALFDSVDVVSTDATKPMATLEREFRKSLQGAIDPSWTKKAMSTVNLPFVGHLLKLLSMMG